MAHEHHSARRHPEFVVLEIGDGVGALIVHTDHTMHGVEIEISPAAQDDRRSHKEVLERVAAGHPAYTAVFDRLPDGRYTLWSSGVAQVRNVRVRDGEITELHWPRPTVAAA